jgi:hypothetical protein
MTAYQLAFGNADAALRLISTPQCIQPETVPHLYLCHSRTTWRNQFIAQLTQHLKDTFNAADLRCTIIRVIINGS